MTRYAVIRNDAEWSAFAPTPLTALELLDELIRYDLCEIYELDDTGRPCRLLRWDRYTEYMFRADVAEHVLHLFERECPDDRRSRNTIEVVRRYARGDATDDDLKVASAWTSASVSAWASVSASAWASASVSAWASASVSVKASNDERKWQAQRLLSYLDSTLDIATTPSENVAP